jgi:hypothetical protein
MRKILLASTALVAVGSVAAHAADLTITGSSDWHYISFDNASSVANNNGTSIDYDTDIDFTFTETTDSGLSLTLGVGLSETVSDDQFLAIAGDFGTIRLANDNGFGDSPMDESVADNTSSLTAANSGLQMGSHAGDLGTNTVMYTLPTMSGLTVGVSHQDAGTTTKGDNTTFSAVYSADVATGAVTGQFVSGSTDDNGAAGDVSGTDYQTMALRVALGDVQVTGSQHSASDNGNVYDLTNNILDVRYTGIEGFSMSAFVINGDDDKASSYDFAQTAASVTYTIASGLTASVTITDTEVTNTAGTKSNDDATVLNIRATF